MFIPARHDLLLAKAEEIYNLIPAMRPMNVLTACRIHRQTMPAAEHGMLTNNGSFTKTWDYLHQNGNFPTSIALYIHENSTELANAEWWFLFILAWKHSGPLSNTDELKATCLKYYLNYIRNLLTSKKPFINGTNESEILHKVYKMFYGPEHVTLGAPAFRMSLNTAMALVVEGWSSRFNTFTAPTGTRKMFPWEHHYDVYRDIVDLHVDNRVALPDAIGIVVTQHREALAVTLQELLKSGKAD